MRFMAGPPADHEQCRPRMSVPGSRLVAGLLKARHHRKRGCQAGRRAGWLLSSSANPKNNSRQMPQVPLMDPSSASRAFNSAQTLNPWIMHPQVVRDFVSTLSGLDGRRPAKVFNAGRRPISQCGSTKARSGLGRTGPLAMPAGYQHQHGPLTRIEGDRS
jgi:hypothetical protein